MKPIIIQIWKVCWQLMLCLAAVSAITVSVLLFITYQDHIDSYYIDKELSEAVCSHRYYNRNESRIYNRDTQCYTLKGIQWVAKATEKDSLTVFCRDGERGYFNVNTGEPVITEQYRRAWVFSEGLAAVMQNGKIGFINSRNEIVLPFKYDYAYRDGMPTDYVFHDGYCTMTNANGECGLIDETGEWVINAQYDHIGPSHDGKYRIVKDGDHYGLLNEKLEFIFPVEYDRIEYSDEKGLFLSKGGYKWQADYDGTILKPFVYDSAKPVNFASGYEDKDSYGDEDQVSELKFTLTNQYMTYTIDGKCGIVRKDNGKVIIPALFRQINMVSPTLFEVREEEDGKWMLIDIHGKIIENGRQVS